MLRVIPKARGLLVPVLDMSRKVLGISWLNGSFSAALEGSSLSASWACPTPVNDEPAFASALAEAVRQTSFSGSKIMLVLDHRSLLFHVQETPPGADKLIDQLLERAVEKSQFFPEQAAWRRLSLPSAKGRRRFLLALLPSGFVRGLAELCAAQRLELVGVFPLVSVLAEHLRALPVPEEETVLLGARVGDAIHLLLGKGDGAVLFSRTIVTGASLVAERLVQELNRTRQFAQQQFGAHVSRLFIFGSETFRVIKELPVRDELTIQASPIAEEPLYYARQVAAASPRAALNLAPRSERFKKPLQRLAAVAVAALFCASVAVAVLAQLTVRARERAEANRARQWQAEEQIRSAARTLQRQATRWRAFVDVVGSTNDAPVAELFARYLATAVPDAIRLAHVDLHKGPAGWSCRLEGFAREQAEGFLAQMEDFERKLRTGIFNLRITDSTYQRLLAGTAQPAGARSNERAFFITATIQ